MSTDERALLLPHGVPASKARCGVCRPRKTHGSMGDSLFFSHCDSWWCVFLPSTTHIMHLCVFKEKSECTSCFLPIHSGHQWTYQPGSHRRKVTQDFSSTFFLRCMPYFFSREGFSHSFPSSTVKSNLVY